jgi:hypothetical protein
MRFVLPILPRLKDAVLEEFYLKQRGRNCVRPRDSAPGMRTGLGPEKLTKSWTKWD